VLPWPEFKLLIFDFYEHRIFNSPELLGATNTNYTPLEEYLIIYFLDHHKSRKMTEYKLVEFIISLRYYVDIWLRAKLMAQLLGFLRPSKDDIKSLKFGSSNSPDAQPIAIDIYLQEFFLYAYSVIMQDKDQLLETKEGHTYVKMAY